MEAVRKLENQNPREVERTLVAYKRSEEARGRRDPEEAHKIAHERAR